MKICSQCKIRYPNETERCLVEGAPLVDLPDPRLGTLLAGRYVIDEIIGEGGMATVYRARHKLIERPVAIKIMDPLLASDPVVRERFRREARSAQRLAHPNIIEIFDQGDTDDGTCYIVMELLRGQSLASIVYEGHLAVDRAVHIMVQIARGIARAHDLEVIHRDIKPENIFLCRREDGSDLVKLLDFGIAKSRQDSRLTEQGELFGTPQYMAPERILGNDNGGSSDLYALGVVFFEMLTGELPFDAPDVATFFVKHMNEPPPSVRSKNPRVPARLDDLVVRMLAKDPKDRPADAHRVHADLLEIVRELEIAGPPAADAEPTSVAGPITLTAGPADHWVRRVFVLGQMLSRAFGSKQSAPDELKDLLAQVTKLVHEVSTARTEGLEAQRRLEEVDLRGRDKRAQLGFAVDQLGVDSSKAKEDLRAARSTYDGAAGQCRQARERFEQAHKDVVIWEGRSGFAEPWPDLARAYRAVANAVDDWNSDHAKVQRSLQACESKERIVHDLDFQIRELRAALAKHEQDLDDERETCRTDINKKTAEGDLLEGQLLELTMRLCTPLRPRTDLAPMFEELALEGDAAA